MPCRVSLRRSILLRMNDNEDMATISRRGILRAAGGAALAGAAGVGFGPGEAAAGGRPALVIADGVEHHWESDSIWVVPDADPTKPPAWEGTNGPAVAGQQAYVWARVENQGTGDATNAKISYYWGDPSAQLYYS